MGHLRPPTGADIDRLGAADERARPVVVPQEVDAGVDALHAAGDAARELQGAGRVVDVQVQRLDRGLTLIGLEFAIFFAVPVKLPVQSVT